MCHVVAAKICCIFSGAAVNTAICLCIRDTHTYSMYIYNIYIYIKCRLPARFCVLNLMQLFASAKKVCIFWGRGGNWKQCQQIAHKSKREYSETEQQMHFEEKRRG